ncbi:hypothetical protein TanjilG_31736 [Lupinus angustifolius]|uniref:HECT-type E3 ubiquitin transferase n=1 Tax=Lupinus angustifolius TaxID=3871 RepID=A0A4P1RMK0_LUPAN|nr:hypothetical protein TanjilG_31736 [Lupinus angustifolius]
MSVIETTNVDFFNQCNHSSKHIFDDCVPIIDDCAVDFQFRMKKDEPKAVNSTSNAAVMSTEVIDRVSNARSAPLNVCAASNSESTRYNSRLQFFVRMISNTVVMHACPQDSVRSVHERIEMITGIPITEQCFIYRGKHLRWEQTLYECAIESDASVQMVGRMRSTLHPRGWQIMEEMVSMILRLCRGEIIHYSLQIIKDLMTTYLNPTWKKIKDYTKFDSEYATSYFNIFLSSNAHGLLVMLYISSGRSYKQLADLAIKHFMSSCQTIINRALQCQRARLVLEFCKVLKRVGSDDPLYMFSRNTFISLLETAKVSYCSVNGKGNLLLQDISPFVRELADKLLRDLDLSKVVPLCLGPLINDVRDFSAFLVPMRKGINELQTSKDSSKIKELHTLKGSIIDDENLHEELLRASLEADNLHLIFIQLLRKMGECLHNMEGCLANKEIGAGDFVSPAWSQYLSILKELYQITKLYDGTEDMFWRVLMPRRRMVCLLIVKFAKRTDDHRWILDHKAVTDFESRRHLVLMLFPGVREDFVELHEMLIDRSKLFAESFNYIKQAEAASLRAGLFMEFKNEEATGPGVLREWFYLVCHAIFNPQNVLFLACPNDRRRFFPNPASKVDPMHLEYFKFSGRVIALALKHRVQVGIVLDRVFVVQLMGRRITLEDIQDADPYFYSSCKQILEMDADFIDSDALGLTFATEVEELGHRKVVELCRGGERRAVNSKNREKYVNLLIQSRFGMSVFQQVFYFAKGFADILSDSKLRQFFFQSLELKDLDWMLHGSEKTISVEDWKAHTEYNGYKESDHQISWFWEECLCLTWQKGFRGLDASWKASLSLLLMKYSISTKEIFSWLQLQTSIEIHFFPKP